MAHCIKCRPDGELNLEFLLSKLQSRSAHLLKMKTLSLLSIFSLLALSILAVAGHQSPNGELSQAATPQSSFEDQILSSDAVADVRSVVLRHIANVTALFAEEYLKDLVASGIDAFGVSMVEALKSRQL